MGDKFLDGLLFGSGFLTATLIFKWVFHLGLCG